MAEPLIFQMAPQQAQEQEQEQLLPTPTDPNAQIVPPAVEVGQLQKQPGAELGIFGRAAGGIPPTMGEQQFIEQLDPIAERIAKGFAAPPLQAVKEIHQTGKSLDPFSRVLMGTGVDAAIVGPAMMAGGVLGGPLGAGVAGIASSGVSFLVNSALGFEDFNAVNGILSVVMPAGVEAGGKVVSRLASALPGGAVARAAKSTNIANDLGQRSFTPAMEREIQSRMARINSQTPLPKAVNSAYNAIRQSTEMVNLPRFASELRNLPEEAKRSLVQTVNRIDSQRFGPIMQRLLDNRPSARVPNPPTQGARGLGQGGVSPTNEPPIPMGKEVPLRDLADLRQQLASLKDAKYREQFAGGPNAVVARQRAIELDEVTTVLDKEIDTLAANGHEGARALQSANRLASVQFAQEELAKLIIDASKTFRTRKGSGVQVDVKKIDDAIFKAREKVRLGLDAKEDVPLARFIRTLDRLGGPEVADELSKSLKELGRLSPRNNMQLFTQTFGILTRGAELVADASGLRSLSEVLLTKPGQELMIHIMRETKGAGIPQVMLGTGQAMFRTMMFGQHDNVDLSNETALLDNVKLLGMRVKDAARGRQVGPNINDPLVAVEQEAQGQPAVTGPQGQVLQPAQAPLGSRARRLR